MDYYDIQNLKNCKLEELMAWKATGRCRHIVKAALVYLRANLDEYNDIFTDYDTGNQGSDCITEKQLNDVMRELGFWDNVGQ